MTRSLALTRRIEWDAAFDRTHPDPNQNFGRHGVEMRWLVIGPAGVIQWIVYTGWMLDNLHGAGESMRLHRDQHHDVFCLPMAADLGIHSYVPLYYDDDGAPGGLFTDHCRLLDGPCYYDGSGLNAQGPLALLIMGGGDAVWRRLEAEYFEHFRLGHALLEEVARLDAELAVRSGGLVVPRVATPVQPDKRRTRHRRVRIERST